ncbi:hypothetical protein Tco_1017117 [Tanacetum coccineum]|uniref:Retroviral polymerase SH3-like domain-containing protein n=1 Tax=Tanacetum coccineum TaxID=301880 RepID=A0ABQ5FSJ2_9ASTR
MVPRAILMKSGLVSHNTARQVNIAHPKITMNSVRPMTNLSKSAHSTVKWPIHKNTVFKNNNFNQRVNTVKDTNFNTTRPKEVVNAARPKVVVNVVMENNVNAVKASACWVWKPKTKGLDHDTPQMDLQDKGVIDSGCSRHMTWNMSYLTRTMKRLMEDIAYNPNTNHFKNLVRGLPSKLFENDLTVFYVKGNSITKASYDGFFVGYSLNSKAFRVFNSRTRIVEENLHIRFSESTPNVARSRPDWLFNIDALIRIINYEPIVIGTQSNSFAGTKASDNAGSQECRTDPMENSKPCSKYEMVEEVNVISIRYQVNPKVSHLHAMKRIFMIPQSSGLTERVADEAVYKELDNDDADMFGCEYLTVMRVLAEQEVATKDVNLTVDECARVQRFVLDKLNHCYNSNSKERIVIIEVRYNLQTITSIPHNMIRHKFKAKARENGLELEYALKEEISNQF